MLAAAVDPAIRQKLARLLGMLGSEHDGEALNAGRLADKLVRSAGLSWHEVLNAAAEPVAIDVLLDWPVRWQAAARLVAEAGVGALREKDLAFARVVAGYANRPSGKQLGYLHDLVRRVIEARP